MKRALIVFTRNLEAGHLKTRLSNDIGEKNSLQVYTELQKQLIDATGVLDCERFVYAENDVTGSQVWDNPRFTKRLQEGGNWGDKMKNAFFELFEQGFKAIVAIDDDCPGITGALLEDAFDQLTMNEVVVGPTEDGGYYLLGLTQLIPDLFKNKDWDSDTVLRDTILTTVQLRKQCVFLPELFRIKTADDLDRFRQMPQQE